MTKNRKAEMLFWDGGDVLGEGPCWNAEASRLMWLDIMDNELHSVAPDGSGHEVVHTAEKVHALAATADPAYCLCTAHRHGLAWLHLPSGRLDPIVDPEPEREKNLLNDGCCGRDGTFWFASMNKNPEVRTGALYSVDGSRQVVRHHDGLGVSNGIALSLDGRQLFLADTYTGIWRFSVVDGRAKEPRLIFRAEPARGAPDGLTMDTDGCLWIAMALAGEVVRMTPDGVIVERVDVPSTFVTSCTFGGSALETLFITTARAGRSADELAAEPHAGGLFTAGVGVRGVAPVRFAGCPAD